MRFKIPAKQPANFKASALYLAGLSKGQSPDRVAWVMHHNLLTESPRAAAAIMEATASQNLRCKQHAYHFVLAFDPKDAKRGKVPPEVMQDIAREAIKRLGLTEHQALVYAHKDTDHPHIHFLVNRVHPITGKAYDRHGDGLRLRDLCRDIAKERGLNVLQDRARIAEREHVDDFDDITPQITEGEYWQAKREERAPQVAMTTEQAKMLRANVEGIFHSATSWDDLASQLGGQGVFLERKGHGLIITQGDKYAKLSQMGKSVRLRDLEDRFGERFADYVAERAKLLADQHHADMRPDGWEDMSPDQQKRAQRLLEAQLAVERKRGDRIHELEEAELDFQYWQGIETSYKFGERKVYRLEREKNFLGGLKTKQETAEYVSRQKMLTYAKKVFRKPEQAMERWKSLEQEHGSRVAEAMVLTNPQLLGGLQGAYVLGSETGTRKHAKRAFKFLVAKRKRWQEKQAKVYGTIAKLKQNHENLQVAIRDFETIKDRVGSHKELKRILMLKIKRRAKAIEHCSEQLIRDSRLEEHRKQHYIRARRAEMRRQKEIARILER